MKVSVIIPSYNGARKLPTLMDALAVQDFSEFELIVVLDGSTDNSKDILEDYRGRFHALKVIEQSNSGRSVVRNTGVNAAQGELLIFYDDDMAPTPGSVGRHFSLLSDDPNRIIAGCANEYHEVGKTDIQNYKAHIIKKWIGVYPSELNLLNQNNLFLTAANCSMSKGVFRKLHGFDARLKDAEDFDLAIRAVENGVRVYFDPRNIAVHHDRITCRSYILRLREYQTAQRRLAELHPGRAKSRVYLEKNIFKKVVYRVLAQSMIVRWIDRERFKFLPTPVRFALYDMTIHALAHIYPSTQL